MSKNWLIRTHNYQLLGPTTKENVIELIEDETLRLDDELSSGNGYWFALKEKDLLDKYVYGTEVQPFNPVNSFEGEMGHFEEGVLPGNDDLEYPEEGECVTAKDELMVSRMAGREEILSTQTDEEQVDREDVGVEEEVTPEEDDEEVQLPDSEDLEYPEDDVAEEEPESEPESEPGPSKGKQPSSESLLSFIKTFLMTIVIIFILLFVCEKVFNIPMVQLFFPGVAAQESSPEQSPDINFQNISIQKGVNGLVMTAGVDEVPKHCRKAGDFFLGTFILLDKRNGALERWKSFVSGCASVIPKDIQAILDLPDEVTGKQLQERLVKWKFSQGEWKRIVEIHRLAKKQQKDILVLQKFFAYHGEKKKIFLKIGTFSISQSVLSRHSFGIFLS